MHDKAPKDCALLKHPSSQVFINWMNLVELKGCILVCNLVDLSSSHHFFFMKKGFSSENHLNR